MLVYTLSNIRTYMHMSLQPDLAQIVKFNDGQYFQIYSMYSMQKPFAHTLYVRAKGPLSCFLLAFSEE